MSFVPVHLSAGQALKILGEAHGHHAAKAAEKRVRKVMEKSSSIEPIALNSFSDEFQKLADRGAMAARLAMRSRVAAQKAAETAKKLQKSKALESASRTKFKGAPGDVAAERLQRRRAKAKARGAAPAPKPQPPAAKPKTSPAKPKPVKAPAPTPKSEESGLSSAAKWGLGGAAAGVVGTKMMENSDKAASVVEKISMAFLKQDRPAKVKSIYKALKRDHPNMPAEVKARIAARKGKGSPKSRKPPETGGPSYKAPLHYERKGGKYKAAAMAKSIKKLKLSMGAACG